MAQAALAAGESEPLARARMALLKRRWTSFGAEGNALTSVGTRLLVRLPGGDEVGAREGQLQDGRKEQDERRRAPATRVGLEATGLFQPGVASAFSVESREADLLLRIMIRARGRSAEIHCLLLYFAAPLARDGRVQMIV